MSSDVTSQQFPAFPPCTGCGGTQVGPFKLQGTGAHSTMLQRLAPWWSPSGGRLKLHALVCEECGRVELFTPDLAKLHHLLQRYPNDVRH